ncbi:hypothetical protein C4K04_1732 [Pseudomonas chlororaphis]|uniref:Uncharacterized protein n=1 Tax=Pseudomonas chlororaphis TaxID=587753 RepID=A0A3G7TK95_9PSED|nr:hypothetical protein C4K04_1732 [Pseudomonas chlororaphis]
MQDLRPLRRRSQAAPAATEKRQSPVNRALVFFSHWICKKSLLY